MIKNTNVEYKVSLYTSKFLGYQSKKRNEGEVKVYISTIWKWSNENFTQFYLALSYITLLERICLERAFQKIRLKNRCKKFREDYTCKMDYIACKMFFEN